ncbi:MAG: TonB-dependent receptor [Gammaproteobacteria bacterium]|nr:TonB-dependent receptor [Gammaproteobacteria bacterium]
MMHSKQALFTAVLLVSAQAYGQDGRLDTIIVTGQRAPVAAHSQSVAASQLDASVISASAHTHFNELASRSPGTWVSRGSGQENLTAIRSPVLTGAGSCGAFLILEDGIPIRPAGFCNVNELFEINTAQAATVEIARGPVSAAWGANALHGAINVLQDKPRDRTLLVGTGPDDFYRARAIAPLAAGGSLLLNIDHDGGFRANSGYDQGKFNLLFGGHGLPRIRFAATRLQQETAGFVVGDNAYRNEALRTGNPNPEAFRDADAQRLSVNWAGDWDLTAYARHSRMRFLQHFLPGQPLEQNGQHSLGVNASTSRVFSEWTMHWGVDAELARGRLTEIQSGPTMGSDFLRETRPQGVHYDYQADTGMLGVWWSGLRKINDRLSLQLAGRVETLHYDYDNRATTGNLRDDGTQCGFGGCLYNRPADRNDSFSNFAPRVALVGQPIPAIRWWAQAASGFRPPQATELYRLQRGQDTAQLASERLVSGETGLRYFRDRLTLEAVAFAMQKKHFIFRDANGLNVSDGRTSHHGVEISLRWQPIEAITIEIDASQALHRYDFDRNASGGEVISDGAEIDTAPAHLSNSRLRWHTQIDSEVELEWLHTGSYAMDAANSVRYPGHDLINLRYIQPLTRNWALHVRVMNLGDTRYAERADFAFGNQRFFPGRARSLYFDLNWHPITKRTTRGRPKPTRCRKDSGEHCQRD